MNFITQECNGNPLGIRTSQLVTRNHSDFHGKRQLVNETDNINRFLAAHSRRNEYQKWKKQSGYPAKDMRSKSSSTHQFLCGPLNTNRLSRKSHSYNIDTPSTLRLSNFHNLYGNQNVFGKTPWNQQSPQNSTNLQSTPNQNELGKTPWNEYYYQNSANLQPTISDNTTTKSCDSGSSNVASNSSPSLSLEQNLAPYLKNAKNVRISVEKQVVLVPAPRQCVIPDGQVPNPIHVDSQNTCPLYDSSEYEQIKDMTEDQNKPTITQLSDDDQHSPEPSRSRYRFFIGEELPSFIFKNDVRPTNSNEFAKNQRHMNSNRTKPKAREDFLIPLLTSPNGLDICVTEYINCSGNRG